MRQSSGLMLLLLIFSVSGLAQKDTGSIRTAPLMLPISPRATPRVTTTLRNSHYASFGIHVPVGNFAESHIAGASLNYILYSRYFTKIAKKKYIILIGSAGVDYFMGKKTEVAGHDFKYGGYTYLNIQGGINIAPILKGGLSLTAGPSMGIYKGNSDFGWTASLFGAYKIGKKMGAGPGVTFRKHAETNALWTVSARAIYRF